jgi:hypothetical protein
MNINVLGVCLGRNILLLFYSFIFYTFAVMSIKMAEIVYFYLYIFIHSSIHHHCYPYKY